MKMLKSKKGVDQYVMIGAIIIATLMILLFIRYYSGLDLCMGGIFC